MTPFSGCILEDFRIHVLLFGAFGICWDNSLLLYESDLAT